MERLTALSQEPKQAFIIRLDSGEINFNLEYKPQQLGWFLSFTYGDYAFNNIRIVTSPNILRAYTSYLPFGLMILTEDDLEPLQVDDFSTGYANMYLLTGTDIQEIETNYYARIK